GELGRLGEQRAPGELSDQYEQGERGGIRGASGPYRPGPWAPGPQAAREDSPTALRSADPQAVPQPRGLRAGPPPVRLPLRRPPAGARRTARGPTGTRAPRHPPPPGRSRPARGPAPPAGPRAAPSSRSGAQSTPPVQKATGRPAGRGDTVPRLHRRRPPPPDPGSPPSPRPPEPAPPARAGRFPSPQWKRRRPAAGLQPRRDTPPAQRRPGRRPEE